MCHVCTYYFFNIVYIELSDEMLRTSFTSGSNSRWVDYDISQLGGSKETEEALQEKLKELEDAKEILYPPKEKPKQFECPELMEAGDQSVTTVVDGLQSGIDQATVGVDVMPSSVINDRYFMYTKLHHHLNTLMSVGITKS